MKQTIRKDIALTRTQMGPPHFARKAVGTDRNDGIQTESALNPRRSDVVKNLRHFLRHGPPGGKKMAFRDRLAAQPNRLSPDRSVEISRNRRI